MKKISFSTITLNNLKQVVPIQQIVDDQRFEAWFENDCVVTEEVSVLLKYLLHKHRPYFTFYSEEELKAKFITPILNKVDFMMGDVKDWYERPLKAQFGEVEIGGFTDYMVAKGEDEPELPYFFLQEFKPSTSNTSPEIQLLAELIVASTLNKLDEMKGATVQGQYWKFMIVERKDTKWYYFVSKSFDAADIDDLHKIYRHLLFVKKSIILN